MIPWAKPDFYGYEEKYLKEALKSTWISDGRFLNRLEKNFSNYLRAKESIAVSNCTAAIHLIYLALDLKKGDEVIVPGFGYMAAANLAIQMGLKPIFADVDLNTFCVTAENIKKKISKKTKLIVITHTYGNVCEINPIIKLSKKRKIPLLEDSAESFGSRYNNKQSGTFGDFATFSFQATKTITTGEGGMIVTKKGKSFIEKIRSLKTHGVLKTRYLHIYPGHNFRLTNLQAAIGCAQLKRFEKIVKERKRIFKYYEKLFINFKGVKIQKFNKNVSPVVWTFALVLDEKYFPKRDKLIKQLLKKGVETRNGFYSPCRMKLYSKYKTSHLKNSNYLSRKVICLPFYASLKNNQIKKIYNTVKSFRSF